MSLARLRVLVSGGLGALLLAVGAGVAQAQTGSITGKVTAADAAGGLEGARVQVLGTNQSTFTNREGVYTLRAVPAGTVQLRVVRLGYDQATKSVTVGAGQSVTLDFALTASPFTLDEIVTTASGDQRKAELGNVVNVIQTDELVKEAPIKTMSELLSSRAPGVTITQSSGGVGAGTRIRIRGSNSVSLSNEPLLVVDGIRMESGASSSSIGVGGQNPSRINDINPDEIASIEIVKGPSAAALYGTDAANGIILITTKRGTAGRARWNVWTEQGAIDDDADYPDNFYATNANGATFTGPSGSPLPTQCRLFQVAAGTCSQGQLLSFNPILDDRTSPLVTAYRRQYGASVSGGSEQAQYFLSAEQEWEDGVFGLPSAEKARSLAQSGRTSLRTEEETPNQGRRTNLRANITAQVSPKWQTSVQAGFTDSRILRPQNDNNILGILSSGLTASGLGGLDPELEWGFGRPAETFQLETEQRVRRLTLSNQLNFTPTTWLSLRSIVGVDYTARTDMQLTRFEEGFDFSNLRDGFGENDHRNITQYSVDFGGTATFQLTSDLSSKTSVGAQWFKNSFRGNNAFGETLPPGSVNLGDGTTQFAGETTVERITAGLFAEQVFGYKERLFVTGAVRADRNSAVGQNFGTKYYPKAAISYLISDESFFPTGKILSSLRLRGAFGKSGLQPGTTDALRFFTGVTSATENGDEPGLQLSGLGNPDLKPETDREFEAGLDLNLLDSRIAIEATYFNKKSTDALINVPVPVSVGTPANQFQNIGEVKNEGVELTLNSQIFTSRKFSWDATLTASFIRNRLQSLDKNVPIQLSGVNQQAVVGKPLGGYYARTATFLGDANNDGIIGANEVSIGTVTEFQDESQPIREFTLATGVSLFNNKVRVASQWDYRAGHSLYNLNEEFRCNTDLNCAGVNDPNASFDRQLAAIARTRFGALNTIDGFVENAEFLKLRELSLTLGAPDQWLRSLRMDRMSLTLSARNLWTETNYRGLDPEINGQGNGNFAVREFLTQPLPKQYSARLNISF